MDFAKFVFILEFPKKAYNRPWDKIKFTNYPQNQNLDMEKNLTLSISIPELNYVLDGLWNDLIWKCMEVGVLSK